MYPCKQLQWHKWQISSTQQFWVESRNSAEGRRKGELLTLVFLLKLMLLYHETTN